MSNNDIKKISNTTVMTGDRPTGKLHLGHYIGSLQNRVLLQENNTQYIMIADIQGLTDNMDNPESIHNNIFEVVKDYLSVGIDPKKNIIFLQSKISAISQMTMLFLNFVKYARLIRNPTLKQEINNKFKNSNPNMGFLCYPISQIADITAFQAVVIPVGIDQVPIIEQCNEVVKKINSMCGFECLKQATPLLSQNAKLVGIDGQKKMSKSLNNTICLSDDDETIKKKVFSMFTDPNKISIQAPGNVENNTVFSYLDVFFDDKNELQTLKQKYRKGGVADTMLKSLLSSTLSSILSPIRDKRCSITNQDVKNIIEQGNEKANKVANNTLYQLKHGLKIAF